MPSVCTGNIRKHVLGIFRYPPVDPKALRNFSGLSAAPVDSQSIVRGVFRGDMQKHTLHRMHFARGDDLALRIRGAYAIRPYLTNRKSYP